ncbi:CU044_2847 family protein [Streptomyces sp. NPDC056930]|uniref:CU044_2847 family protein n=1 Tax=Streptomyces sp. NPDC056930 TaxID=3345967 RepID=UPI00363675F7
MAYLVELPVSGAGGARTGGEEAGSAPSDATGIVKVQIDEAADGLVQVARPGQVVARATRSLNDMLAGIRPVAENFVDGFRDMARQPDEIGVEFGLSLSAEADVVISRTTGQANFKVTLTWRNSSSGEPAADAAG